MVDCLEHSIVKENELPRIIEIIFNKISNHDSHVSYFNKNMRSADEILKDYGLK